MFLLNFLIIISHITFAGESCLDAVKSYTGLSHPKNEFYFSGEERRSGWQTLYRSEPRYKCDLKIYSNEHGYILFDLVISYFEEEKSLASVFKLNENSYVRRCEAPLNGGSLNVRASNGYTGYLIKMSPSSEPYRLSFNLDVKSDEDFGNIRCSVNLIEGRTCQGESCRIRDFRNI